MVETETAERGLEQPDVVDKYKGAAAIANAALKAVVQRLTPGASIVELAELGDAHITAAVEKVFTKPVAVPDSEKTGASSSSSSEKKKVVDKGVAFPTCLSVNECAAHFSPLDADDLPLALGDLVKIELACHIDGFIAVAATSAVVAADPAQAASADPATGRVADVLMAAWTAAEASLRLLRPGHSNQEISDCIARAAAQYNCAPVEGSLSHQMKRYIIDGNKVIPGKPSVEQRCEKIKFEENEVYAIDIAISTGDGKIRTQEAKTTVFKRQTGAEYHLKMSASRKVFSEINAKGADIPFCLRSLQDGKKAKLGITELIAHGLVVPYPVLYEQKGDFIARFSYTALIMPSQTLRITDLEKPNARSDIELTDADLVTLLATSTKKTKKKKQAATTPAPMETS